MPPEEPTSIADAIIDFGTLGGVSAETPEPKISDSPADGFLKTFNEDVAAPAEEAPTTETEVPETPVEEAPAVEKDDIDAIETPANASKKAADDFNKIKDTAKGYKAKLEAAEKLIEAERTAKDAELAELRQKVAELPELSERAKFADDAEKELAIARVEGTKEYRQTIIEPLQAIEAAAEVIAKANEVSAEALIDAISEPDLAKRRELLSEIISGLNDIDKQEILGMSRDVQALLTKQTQIRERAGEAKKELEERTQAETTKAQQKARQEFESATNHTVESFKKSIPFIELAEGETLEGVFASIGTKAKAIDFDSAPVGNKAFAAAAAIALPRVTKQAIMLSNKVKTLEARIAELNAGRATTEDPARQSEPESKGFFENFGMSNPGIGQLK